MSLLIHLPEAVAFAKANGFRISLREDTISLYKAQGAHHAHRLFSYAVVEHCAHNILIHSMRKLDEKIGVTL